MENIEAKTRLLSIDEVMNAYEEVSKLYPHAPSMSIWRSWELAAYRRYELPTPILDVGCGDGQYFKLVWPTISDVVGIDINPAVVNSAIASGVYNSVLQVSATDISLQRESFSSVFANCSLEHMDNLSEVLIKINEMLRKDGQFLLSIVTDKFIEWTTLPELVLLTNEAAKAESIKNHYSAYHHLVTALPPIGWANKLEEAGFEVIDYIPIMPELISRLDLFVDCLWHIPHKQGEFGNVLGEYFKSMPRFPDALGEIMRTLLTAERDWALGSGAVFNVKKRRN